jgi:hypothetical protein
MTARRRNLGALDQDAVQVQSPLIALDCHSNLGALDQDAVQVQSPLIALALYLMVLDGP